MVISCYGVELYKFGFDSSGEWVLYNILVVCVFWEYLWLKKIEENFMWYFWVWVKILLSKM